ncbi:glycosyltransferase [Zeaxanthinibacter sp. PT1]|uniref:glycosyltransferase n=1 Tax=Zeaxanthinibacter TaxID=561554 RepID=UPI00234BC0CB|nr:glycosyltransferase [Zeaxanthinibacter sp. PT1]MDC6351957.1 glycosyltransferase [Zeaxanthinibacter sp. PT1]
MKKNSQFISGTSTLRKRFQGSAKQKVSTLSKSFKKTQQTGILLISTFPPRECGIATYAQDLMTSLEKTFGTSLNISICPLEGSNDNHSYPVPVKYSLCTDCETSFKSIARQINLDPGIDLVLLQHEFGLFRNKEEVFQEFLERIQKPVILAFHTVIPSPEEALRNQVKELAQAATAITVMTKASKLLLVEHYGIEVDKIQVIAHGTHLILHADREELKEKYGLRGRKVLSTFGLLGPGKSIETTLAALPAIIAQHPETLFLILGKTHPVLQRSDGESYRNFLENKIQELGITGHTRFVNRFLPLDELLEYLQLSDVYLFTSKDPNQAVSGTFSYALGCGCPIISTPIPHAREVLENDRGEFVDFNNSEQLGEAVIRLLDDPGLRHSRSQRGLHTTTATAWENSAIAHGLLFEKIDPKQISLSFQKPPINLDHLKRLTTDFGIIQFAELNKPDPSSGYTLDDNARALMVCCRYYTQTRDRAILPYIERYFNFVSFCQSPDGTFSNYVDIHRAFTPQNNEVNLEDSNGRAIWALGNFLYHSECLPDGMGGLKRRALQMMHDFLPNIAAIGSPRAIAFIIKGLYYLELTKPTIPNTDLIDLLTEKLIALYDGESEEGWNWFEPYLTYANSTLPDAILCAYLVTGKENFANTARESFDFLWSKIFRGSHLQVISNRNWLQKSDKEERENGGEQPIDVAYTILALEKFDTVWPGTGYGKKKEAAFSWFLGNNQLHQVIYNPRTGGCYDGLESKNVNLNQGAESTLSYLLARLLFNGNETGSDSEE